MTNILPEELIAVINDIMSEAEQSKETSEQLSNMLSNMITGNYHKDDLEGMIEYLTIRLGRLFLGWSAWGLF